MTNDELIEKYPKIFQGERKNHGWNIPDGWVGIIDDLCYLIQRWCDNTESVKNPDFDESLPYSRENTKTHRYIQVVCVQMKEKFGSGRFYVNSATEYVYGLITFAEYLCGKTCVYCSSQEDIKFTTGWIVPVCSKCAISKDLKTNNLK